MTTGFWLEHVGRGGKYSLRKEKQIRKGRLSSCEHVGLGCFRTSEEMLGRQVDTWTQKSGEMGQSAACVGGSPGIIEWGETRSLFRSALPLFRPLHQLCLQPFCRQQSPDSSPCTFPSQSFPVCAHALPLEPGSNVTGSVDRSSHNRNDTFTCIFPPEVGEVNILQRSYSPRTGKMCLAYRGCHVGVCDHWE